MTLDGRATPVYGLPAAELVRNLAATGAVGCNLEDSAVDELAAAGVARISFGSALRRAGSSRLPEMLSAIRAGDDPFEASG